MKWIARLKKLSSSKALMHFYPELRGIRLTDFKVRVVNVKEGTAAKVRVLVESADDHGSWTNYAHVLMNLKEFIFIR